MTATAGLDERLHELGAALRAKKRWDERRRQGPALEALLAHTLASVPAYSDLARERQGCVSFCNLPVTERRQVAADPSKFRSRRFCDEELSEFSTSGTTGIPLVVARDLASLYAFAYDTYRLIFERVPGLRSYLAPGQPAVAVVNDNPQRSNFVQINPSIEFAMVRRLVIGRSPDEDRAVLLSLCRDTPPLLYGRPRSLLRLSELAHDLPPGKRARIRPKAILASGDNLYNTDRNTIEQCFHATVYNAYASQEAGLAAMECVNGNMHVFPEHGAVEVLRSHGAQPSPEGHGELVISNFENWAMPFLRYRSGDVGELQQAACSCGFSGTTISRVEGRESIYFIVGGRRLNPSVLNSIFEQLPIRQFQVIQRSGSSFEARWVGDASTTDASGIERAVSAAIQHLTGPADVHVCRVATIGGLGEKAQRYVQESAASDTPSGARY